MQNSGKYGAISASLVRWFETAHRDLPWRRTQDAYAIWVAEVMLQQTQVVIVIPYYERFMARFPTVDDLAGADLGEVLALWQGLGYYSRARNLHAAARVVCEQLGGRLPQDVAALRALPGIGEYIAAAIASIVFGIAEPAVDANAIRVITRIFDLAEDPSRAAVRREICAHGRALLPSDRPGLANQALMELGATICLPRKPLCAQCPISAHCVAVALGIQELRPVRRARRDLPRRDAVAAFIAHQGRMLLVRRLPRGLLGGLWELPGGELRPGEEPEAALRRVLRADLGLDAEVGGRRATLTRTYSHFRATTAVHECRLNADGLAKPSGAWDHAEWLAADEVARYALTGATLQALRALAWLRGEPNARRNR